MLRYIIFLATSCILSSVPIVAAVAETPNFVGGHAKYLFLLNTFPDDSLFLDFVDTPAVDHNGDLRMKFDWRKDIVSLVSDYQLIARHGDSIALSGGLPGTAMVPNPVQNDDHRLFDLTGVVTQGDRTVLTHRLDRLYINYAGQNAVARFGRQAVSWGNGLVYTPMDFFNPFDPSAVDREYKTGDDMLYGQYLQSSGNDLQAVWVIRRDDNGNVTSDVDSVAVKYHGFDGDNEYDLLVAKHFSDNILGIGGIASIGGAIVRGDITLTDTQADNAISLVTNLSYSSTLWNHNVSGVLEYFYNGFGQKNGDYSPDALAENPDLLDRLIRGELFTLTRQYVAASAQVEMTPLWILAPSVFINASDGSFLAQLVSTYDLKQDWQLLAALSLPAGGSGTEHGGIDSGVAGKQFSSEINLFAQLTWYF